MSEKTYMAVIVSLVACNVITILALYIVRRQGPSEYEPDPGSVAELKKDLARTIKRWRLMARSGLLLDENEPVSDVVLIGQDPLFAARLVMNIEERCNRDEIHTPSVPTNG